ncbi:DUF1905 domain-containing protein [Roseivirga thermotolerans]|uniref:DUF1905 domain-containing protein n=1 Tax=Roseivirga thermotolerans TaxID=1758176 RepID=A0ABQ3I7H1_9BACT|nr:DUF1905 domain-containing protein [Roseivirga thermotolerans]GHE71237.1 hypothetical protein GCM10011340_28930 [Roseivirga thermotolerans]
MVCIETHLQSFDWSTGYYHFPIDKATTTILSSTEHRRVVCTINQSVTIHAALMPLGEGSYIMINKKVRQQLKLKEGDRVELQLKKDESEYGMPMPETLRLILDQDELGSRYFHSLTAGKQRNLIYIVSKVKSIDRQINKALAIMEHLKDVHGQLDFKLLNEKIKQFNQNI